jgi:small subunit ribosomal protein S11
MVSGLHHKVDTLWSSLPNCFSSRASYFSTESANTNTASTSGSGAEESPGNIAPPPRSHRFGPRKVSDLKRSKALQTGLEGVIHVYNTYNNIFLTLTDKEETKTKSSLTAGCVGFKNVAKSTPLAAEKAAEEMGKRALKLGFANVSVKLKGPGRTKMYAVQGLHATGLRITQLQDVTPIPYNGCRPPKKRRT